MGIVLEGEVQVRLKYLTTAMAASTSTGKSAYTTWLRFFYEGDGSQSEFMDEAFLAYWLSWYVLPSGPEERLTPMSFPYPFRLQERFSSLWIHLPGFVVCTA